MEQKENMVWEILCRPGKKAKIGTRFVFGGGKLKAEIIDVLEDGNVSHDLSARRISLPHLTR